MLVLFSSGTPDTGVLIDRLVILFSSLRFFGLQPTSKYQYWPAAFFFRYSTLETVLLSFDLGLLPSPLIHALLRRRLLIFRNGHGRTHKHSVDLLARRSHATFCQGLDTDLTSRVAPKAKQGRVRWHRLYTQAMMVR